MVHNNFLCWGCTKYYGKCFTQIIALNPYNLFHHSCLADEKMGVLKHIYM